MATPGTWPFCPSANIQATRITRAGFMNSDGCRVKPPNSSQRVAPLALWPMNGRMIMMATAASQMKNEARRTTFTSSIDVPIRITAAAAAKTHCRTAKWKGSPTFIRAAAAGLAANDMATPMKIRIEQHAQHPAVDGPPPDADGGAVGAREGVGLGRTHAAPAWAGSRAMTAERKASPRSSKSANWSKLAPAGDRSTMASWPEALASA
jgi:hypothetical protein